LPRSVKGVLFADYVRMIRSHKGVDYSQDLLPADMSFLIVRIDPEAWYPMATFERLGNAILRHVAGGALEAVRMWGRYSVEQLRDQTPELVCEKNPVETLMRFRVLRRALFDFEALQIPTLFDGHAEVLIDYGMGRVAEEAASVQTLGFFERLLELTGASRVNARFSARSWAGDARTCLELDWV
jgi:hypothetical protein